MSVDKVEYIIYRIESKLTDLVYIGSTSQGLKKRLRGHQDSYKAWLQGKVHKNGSFDILSQDPKASIVELERVIGKKRSDICENHHWRSTDNTCNIREPGAVLIAGGKKAYSVKKTRRWHAANPERSKAQNVKFRAKNPEYSKAQGVKYRAEHKEAINARKREKVECVCGAIINRSAMSKHTKKTKKHLDFMLYLSR